MIGYYIHHHGFGHLARAISISSHIHQPVVALTSLRIPEPHPFAAVISLARDDAEPVQDPGAHGALHWAPRHHPGYSQRMQQLAAWVAQDRPRACVIDVSVEVSVLLRLLGIPVAVMALPGDRFDPPHELVHRLADHIVAAWPRQLAAPVWLHAHEHKTSYVGGISRFDGRPPPPAQTCEPSEPSGFPSRALVFGGAGGGLGGAPAPWQPSCPNLQWDTVGGQGGSWTDDPWPQLCAADVVISHAGQSCIADIAAARRPAVVIAQPRPYGEQEATATMLARRGLAIAVRTWPHPQQWPDLLAKARAIDPGQWVHWQVAGAAARAAAAIESIAEPTPRRTNR